MGARERRKRERERKGSEKERKKNEKKKERNRESSDDVVMYLGGRETMADRKSVV